MKIENIRIAHLRNDEHFQLITEFRDLVAASGAAALKIEPQFNAFLSLYEREDEALKKIVKSEFTAKIHDADKARDDIYIGMEEMAAAALRHFNPAVRDAAARLQILFDTYGNVAKKSLDEETSAIYNILQELEGKYAPDAAAVGIVQWASELKARKAADKAFKQICEIINVYMVLEGESAYETSARTINEVIARYKKKHRHHHHHRLNPDTPDSQDNNHQPNGGTL